MLPLNQIWRQILAAACARLLAWQAQQQQEHLQALVGGEPSRQQHTPLLRGIEHAKRLQPAGHALGQRQEQLLMLRQQNLMLSQWPLLLAKWQCLLVARAEDPGAM